MRLRKWVKVVIKSIVIVYVGVAIVQLFTIHTSTKTEYGWSICDGGLIKICTGSKSMIDE
jgi:hypothetical protein